MTDQRKFRVVVVGVAKGQDMSAKDLAGSLNEYFPLPADAQVAIQSGRSAVVQVAESEYIARRAATMLIKLGAEIRIEPDDSGPGALDFDDADFSGLTDELDDAELPPTPAPPPTAARTQSDPTVPARPADLGGAPLVDRPPDTAVDEDAITLPPRPSMSRPPDRTTRELESVGPNLTESARLAAVTEEQAEPADKGDGEAAADEQQPRLPSGERGELVRCPAHGLLYDATQSPGCSRCLGPSAEPPFRLAPELRKKPRLWLTLGLALGLLLGAVPAVLYAQNVKAGSLYERRIEADAVRRAKADTEAYKKQYAAARAKVIATRNRGIAVSALIWIGIAAGLMLLWYRFV